QEPQDHQCRHGYPPTTVSADSEPVTDFASLRASRVRSQLCPEGGNSGREIVHIEGISMASRSVGTSSRLSGKSPCAWGRRWADLSVPCCSSTQHRPAAKIASSAP